jgi:RNA polymerase sigma-70 factor, ECF subfamily
VGTLAAKTFSSITSPDGGNSSAGDRLVEQWRAAEGEEREQIFRQIFLLYHRQVRRWFERRNFSPEESKDLTQDTFLKVHLNLASFRGETTFTGWLFTIATSIYLNRKRALFTRKRNAPEVRLSAEPEADPEKGPGYSLRSDEEAQIDRMLAEERSKLLHEAMKSLPKQMRNCVMLRVDRDLKYREIAVLLDVSVDTVKAHLFQARQQLRERLGDYFGDIDL